MAQRITVVRGQGVLLDADLASFYGETTKRLNQQVTRNQAKFPEDFMFRLTDEEFANLRLQSATSSPGHGGRRYAPLAFTEHGAIMAAMVLNSERAAALSVYVVRAFVELRGLVSTNKELAGKVHNLERKVSMHERSIGQLADAMAELLATPAPHPKRPIDFVSRNTRAQLKQVFDALHELTMPPDPPKRPIGFVAPEDKGKKAAVAQGKA